MANQLPRFPKLVGWDADLGQQVPSEEQDPPFGIHAVVLEPRGRDGLGLLGVGEHRLVAQAFKHIHQPPLGARGLNGDGGRRGEVGEEALRAIAMIREAMLPQLPVSGQHGHLRDPFVKIHGDMYHGFGLLPQRERAVPSGVILLNIRLAHLVAFPVYWTMIY